MEELKEPALPEKQAGNVNTVVVSGDRYSVRRLKRSLSLSPSVVYISLSLSLYFASVVSLSLNFIITTVTTEGERETCIYQREKKGGGDEKHSRGRGVLSLSRTRGGFLSVQIIPTWRTRGCVGAMDLFYCPFSLDIRGIFWYGNIFKTRRFFPPKLVKY